MILGSNRDFISELDTIMKNLQAIKLSIVESATRNHEYHAAGLYDSGTPKNKKLYESLRKQLAKDISEIELRANTMSADGKRLKELSDYLRELVKAEVSILSYNSRLLRK